MLVLDHVDVALAGAPILRGAHLEVGKADAALPIEGTPAEVLAHPDVIRDVIEGM